MRFRSLLLLVLPLLASCAKEAGPVRLDFVGATNLTSSNRTVALADSLITRGFASGDNRLTNLTITVTYEPTRFPITYPTVTSTYNPRDTPNDAPLVFMDSTLSVAGADGFAFRNRFGARTTSGTERWEYKITDSDGNTASRAYRIVVRNTDSLSASHNYTMFARTTERSAQSRPYLLLRPGLRLPPFAIRKLPLNQALVDAAIVRSADGLRFVAPAAASLQATTPYWTAKRRRTPFMLVSLTSTAFNAITTSTAMRTAFLGGQPASADSLTSSLLLKDTALAFRTDEENPSNNKYGLIYVSSLADTPNPGITFTVRVQK